MFVRLRQMFVILIAIGVGFALGDGPVADWLADVGNALRMAWASARISRGAGGPVPLLLAGYLLGQGAYLLVRRLVRLVGPWRLRQAEQIASQDSLTRLASRFGIDLYLSRCSEWASDDPTTRTPTLALVRISGLGELNDVKGAHVGTVLLKRFADELKAASLPEGTSPFSRWIRLRALESRTPLFARHGEPQPRLPGRWDCDTFALAFRELDAVKVVAILSDIAEWMRGELHHVGGGLQVDVTAVIVLGPAGVSGRELARAANHAAANAKRGETTVWVDADDVRRTTISHLASVQVVVASLLSETIDLVKREERQMPEAAVRWVVVFRAWGGAVGCLASAAILLSATGSGHLATTNFPWPETLTHVQVVDPSGLRNVRVTRTPLADASTSRWRLSEAVVVQGDPADGIYSPCQVRVRVMNATNHTYYVSSFDFSALDSAGTYWPVEPNRVLRMEKGITGIWVGPGQAITGWLVLARGNAPITGLLFEPDRFSRLFMAKAQGTEGR